MTCNRKEICYHYPKHCELCQATSDVVNHYPCFKDKDIVEVVRCKDCKHRNPLSYWCLRDNLWHNEEDFCSYGERKDNS